MTRFVAFERWIDLKQLTSGFRIVGRLCPGNQPLEVLQADFDAAATRLTEVVADSAFNRTDVSVSQ
jgi:hypothetical protein